MLVPVVTYVFSIRRRRNNDNGIFCLSLMLDLCVFEKCVHNFVSQSRWLVLAEHTYQKELYRLVSNTGSYNEVTHLDSQNKYLKQIAKLQFKQMSWKKYLNNSLLIVLKIAIVPH